jgi:hypothetical protein
VRKVSDVSAVKSVVLQILPPFSPLLVGIATGYACSQYTTDGHSNLYPLQTENRNGPGRCIRVRCVLMSFGNGCPQEFVVASHSEPSVSFGVAVPLGRVRR